MIWTFDVSMNTQWRALLCGCHRLSSLRHCPSWFSLYATSFLSLFVSFLSALTLSPPLTPPSSSSPNSLLLLCSPQSPPKGATIPYRPKPASTPVIFSGGQVRADPLGASTANLSLLLQHQPLPVSVAPGFTHFSSLPHWPHPPLTSMKPSLLFTVPSLSSITCSHSNQNWAKMATQGI